MSPGTRRRLSINRERTIDMTKPKLSSKTPDQEELNSLIDSHDELLNKPDQRRFAVVELAVTARTFPTHNDHFATVQIVHLEEIRGTELDDVLKVRNAVYTQRTGNKSVPEPDQQLDLSGLDDSVDD